MNTLTVFLFALCVAVTYGQQNGGMYTSKYDNINIPSILENPKLVKAYVNCLVNNKQCTPEGSELRRILPEALKTNCAKCSPKQKDGAVRTMQTVQKNYPEEWKKLTAKWDPTGELFKKLQEAIKSGKVSA